MAINFPSTSGQATDGSFTHTASGITWAWDGTTWKAQGETSNYVLPQATNTVLGGIKVGANLSVTAGVLSATAVDTTWTLGANGTNHYTFTGDGFTSATDDPTLYLIRGKTYKFDNQTSGHPFRIQSDAATSGGGTAYNDGITNNNATGGTGTNLLTFVVPMNAPNTLYYQCTAHTSMTGTIHVLTNQQAIALNDLTDVNTAGTTSGQILKYNGTAWAPAADDTGAASGLTSRATSSGTTGSIANDASANLDFTSTAKTYALLNITTDKAAWVTLYTTSATRTSDATRNINTDPSPGSGVIAEVITSSSALSQNITPGTIGFNDDGTPADTVYAKVVNKSGSTGTVQVTIKYVKLEA